MIDWFTLSAQIVNFLILIWLLQRFLYQPILQALDAREARIKAGLQEAEEKKRQAQIEHDEFLQKNQDFDAQRAQLLKIAQDEVTAERQRLWAKVQHEVEEWRSRQQAAFANEQQALISRITQNTQTEVFAMARAVLNDLANSPLEQQMLTVFLAKLQQLSEPEKQRVLAEINAENSPLLIRTAFELSPLQKTELEPALQKLFGQEIHLEFKTVPHLISGIELCSDGQKIAWTVADYISHLEQQLNQVLQQGLKL